MPVREYSDLSHLLYCFSNERASQLPMSGGGFVLTQEYERRSGKCFWGWSRLYFRLLILTSLNGGDKGYFL